MKKSLKKYAEVLARFAPFRGLIRGIAIVINAVVRGYGFFLVRSSLRIPYGSSCHWSLVVKYPENILFEGPVMISADCVFGAMEEIRIGASVRISQGVCIETASLDLSSELPYPHVAKPINIRSGVWLGTHVIVLGGVTIGENAVIGAGTVVATDVPPGAVVVGGKTRVLARKEKYFL